MSENIIINGVNVAECKNFAIYNDSYEEKDVNWCENHQEECEMINNCYYKQLKHLQSVLQEIKEIANKEIYLKQNNSISTIIYKIDEVLQ